MIIWTLSQQLLTFKELFLYSIFLAFSDDEEIEDDMDQLDEEAQQTYLAHSLLLGKIY